MPANPPNEEVVTEMIGDSSAMVPQQAADESELPRTIKRRVARRVTIARPRAQSQENAQPAAGEDTDAASDSEILAEFEKAAQVDGAATAEQKTQGGAADEAGARTQSDAEDQRDVVQKEDHLGDNSGEGGKAATRQRSTRIELPVPSVVRARERAERAAANPVVLRAESLTKSYGQVLAAADISFEVHAGSLTGVVGPNGAGKTTVLSMISGLNRPSSGRVIVRDIDVWGDGPAAKRVIGSLPDRLRLFDRLTGGQLLYYAGVLQGLDQETVSNRARELVLAFGLETALDRPVSDYSAGMQKKIGLACSMIHAPEVLMLDEPYETIDPVSASNVTEILEKYVAGGGSVIMSSHSLDLIQRICDHVVVIVDGSIVAQGTVDAVRDGVSLEERFKHLTHQDDAGKGLGWLRGSSDSE